jgi:DNA-binding MarR family transcriptional regulator
VERERRARRRKNALIEVAVAHQLTSELVDRELIRRGIRPVHVGLLTIVDIHGPITPTALEYETGLPPTTLRERIQGLVDDGYVRRIPNEADRRSYFVDTTPEGEAYLAAADPALRAVERALARVLGEPVEVHRQSLNRLRVASQELLFGEEPAAEIPRIRAGT